MQPTSPTEPGTPERDEEQKLHLFVILKPLDKYVVPLYEGMVKHSQIANKAIRVTELMDLGSDFKTQVYDAEVFTEQEARDDMKRRFDIDPLNEDFYPVTYPNTALGELQQIYGIRPEYTPSDIPFNDLIKWRDKAVDADRAALLQSLREGLPGIRFSISFTERQLEDMKPGEDIELGLPDEAMGKLEQLLAAEDEGKE